MRRKKHKRLPAIILWAYPELERIEGRKAQWEALGRANQLNACIFAALVLLLTTFLPDFMEASFKRVFGFSGATNDYVTAIAYITLLIGAFGALMYFGCRRARRKIRIDLAAAGHAICVTCGYDLRKLPEPRCPECGTPFRESDAKS